MQAKGDLTPTEEEETSSPARGPLLEVGVGEGRTRKPNGSWAHCELARSGAYRERVGGGAHREPIGGGAHCELARSAHRGGVHPEARRGRGVPVVLSGVAIAAGNAHFVGSWVPIDGHLVSGTEGCGPQVIRRTRDMVVTNRLPTVLLHSVWTPSRVVRNTASLELCLECY
ncbi:uncharacterized protein ACBT57_006497 [Dama dama]